MNRAKYLKYTYIISLHIILVVLLWKYGIITVIEKNLALSKPQVAREMGDDYREKIVSHMKWQKLIPQNSIIILGDSITEQIPSNQLPDHFINLGIGNDTTVGVLARLKFYPALQTAKAIILAIGINDLLHRPLNEILIQHKKLITYLSHKAPVFVSLVLPVDPSAPHFQKFEERNNQNITLYNKELKKICVTMKNCRILDATGVLSNEKGDLMHIYHRGDGVHLSDKGYAIWLGKVIKDMGND